MSDVALNFGADPHPDALTVGDGTVLFGGLQTHGPGALLEVLAGTVFLNTDGASGPLRRR